MLIKLSPGCLDMFCPALMVRRLGDNHAKNSHLKFVFQHLRKRSQTLSLSLYVCMFVSHLLSLSLSRVKMNSTNFFCFISSLRRMLLINFPKSFFISWTNFSLDVQRLLCTFLSFNHTGKSWVFIIKFDFSSSFNIFKELLSKWRAKTRCIASN